MEKSQRKKDSRKAIMFDLRIKAIKTAIERGEVQFKKHTSAYGKIRRFLEKAGFEHNQGSGYISGRAMNTRDAVNVFFNLGEKNPWLAPCMAKCILTSFDFGDLKVTDLTGDIWRGAQSTEQDGGLISSPATYDVAHGLEE